MITVNNCLEVLEAKKDDSIPSQAAAWIVVFDYCEQIGMHDWRLKAGFNKTGIENVIAFIQYLNERK